MVYYSSTTDLGLLKEWPFNHQDLIINDHNKRSVAHNYSKYIKSAWLFPETHWVYGFSVFHDADVKLIPSNIKQNILKQIDLDREGERII